MLCLSRVLPSAFLLVGAASAQTSEDVEKNRLIHVDSDMQPIHLGTYHAASGQWFRPSGQATDGGTFCTVYANNFYSAFFLDINDGSLVTDEGRLPSTTSPEELSPAGVGAPANEDIRDVSLIGYDNSYSIEKIQLGYVTNSYDDGEATLQVYEDYDTCTDPTGNPSEVLDITIVGLPGIDSSLIAGTLVPYTFDVDLSGLEFCMLADASGEYMAADPLAPAASAMNRFGWRLGMTVPGDPGALIGPIAASNPEGGASHGANTAFENAPVAPNATGLGTEDQYYMDRPGGPDQCENFGGYIAPNNLPQFASFWLVMEANKDTVCVECGTRFDDRFEPNDSPCAARDLDTPTMEPNLLVYRDAGPGVIDPDYFRITVPAFSVVQVEVRPNFSNLNPLFGNPADFELELYEDDCTNPFNPIVASSGGFMSFESATYFNCSSSSVDILAKVYVAPGATLCGGYDLEVREDLGCAFDDQFEDNDTCLEAIELIEGTYPALTIFPCDEDWYRIILKNGESLDITAVFNSSELDLDLYLFNGNNCITSTLIATSLQTSPAPGSGVENVSLTNNTGMTQTYHLFVDYFTSGFLQFVPEPCGNYLLSYERGGGTPIGKKFCTAQPNSTGLAGHIFGTGSNVVANNDFVLNAQNLPAGVMAMALNSQSNIIIPFPSIPTAPGPSCGNICIAGPGGSDLGRFKTQIVMSSGGGGVSIPIDLTNFPRPLGGIAVVAGETYNFQWWYRDVIYPACGGGSNFTDALEVTFQ